MTSPDNPFAVPLPHRHELARPRLLALLRRSAALLVVRGPVGSGKTTLLAEWLRARSADSTVIWLSVHDDRREPAAVWLDILTALEERGVVAPGAVDTATSGEGEADVAVTLRATAQRAMQEAGRPIAIAIDRGELLHAQSVQQIVDVLAVTPALTLGVTVQRRGAFESVPVRMAVDTAIVDDAELELTAEETATLLASAGLPTEQATVRLVRDAAGGHARATRAALAALSSPRRPKLPELRQFVLESLGWDQVKQLAFAQGDALFFEFLLRCSVLEEVPRAFAEELVQELVLELGDERDDALANGADAAAFLDRAEQWSLCSVTGDTGEPRFRFLTVARNALLAELIGRPGDDAVAAQSFAARWLVRHDALEEGFLLAVAGKDYDTASFAAARRFTRLLGFQSEAVRAALAPLPLLTMRRHPLLAMMLALSYNQVSRFRLRAIEYFGIAILGAKSARPNMAGPERVVLDTVMSGALRIIGQSDGAGQAAKRALTELSTLSDPELRELGTIVDAVTVQSGISLLYSGDPEAALAAFRRSSAPEESPHSLHALAALAGTHAMLGEMRESAELVLEGDERVWPDDWINGYQGSLFQLARALIAIEAFDLDAAQAAVNSIDEHITTIEHWPLFAEAQARIDLFAGRAEVGSDRLNAVRRRKRGRVDLDPGSRNRLDIAASTLHLSSGRHRQADSALAGISNPDASVLVARARVQLVRDAPDAVIALLLEADGQPAPERVRAEQLALECAALLRLGHGDAAGAALERLAGVLDFSELLTPLALMPREDLDDLRALAAERCSAEVVHLLGQQIPTAMHRVRVIVLSDRERVVLRELLATGSVSEIADALFVSTNTVKSQLRSLYRKLGVSSREDALVVAASQRLLEGGS